MNFSPKRAAEVEVFTVDYANILAPGETLSTAVWSVSVKAGTDPAPGNMLSGGAAISGSRVSQFLRGGVVNVTYSPICTVTTSLGETLVLPEPGNGDLLVTR